MNLNLWLSIVKKCYENPIIFAITGPFGSKYGPKWILLVGNKEVKMGETVSVNQYELEYQITVANHELYGSI